MFLLEILNKILVLKWGFQLIILFEIKVKFKTSSKGKFLFFGFGIGIVVIGFSLVTILFVSEVLVWVCQNLPDSLS